MKTGPSIDLSRPVRANDVVVRGVDLTDGTRNSKSERALQGWMRRQSGIYTSKDVEKMIVGGGVPGIADVNDSEKFRAMVVRALPVDLMRGVLGALQAGELTDMLKEGRSDQVAVERLNDITAKVSTYKKLAKELSLIFERILGHGNPSTLVEALDLNAMGLLQVYYLLSISSKAVPNKVAMHSYRLERVPEDRGKVMVLQPDSIDAVIDGLTEVRAMLGFGAVSGTEVSRSRRLDVMTLLPKTLSNPDGMIEGYSSVDDLDRTISGLAGHFHATVNNAVILAARGLNLRAETMREVSVMVSEVLNIPELAASESVHRSFREPFGEPVAGSYVDKLVLIAEHAAVDLPVVRQLLDSFELPSRYRIILARLKEAVAKKEALRSTKKRGQERSDAVRDADRDVQFLEHCKRLFESYADGENKSLAF